jgi:hypothetical protein
VSLGDLGGRTSSGICRLWQAVSKPAMNSALRSTWSAVIGRGIYA